MNSYIADLLNQKEIRQNLIEIKKQLKEENARPLLSADGAKDDASGTLREELKMQTELLKRLLCHEDAKVRKNTAQIIGEMGEQQLLEALCEQYQKEQTLFVRSAYLEAMGQLDYRKVLPVLEARLEEIGRMAVTEENKKHLSQERHMLSELIGLISDVSKHAYTRKAVLSKVILTVRKGREQLLWDELEEKLPELSKRRMNGGAVVAVSSPDELLCVRTWQNMLFAFCKENGFPKDGEQIGKGIVKAGLMDYLKARHDCFDGTWRFRVDVRTKDDRKEKTRLAKDTALAVEAACGGRLVNSVSDYEFEIVLTAGKEDKLFAWLKLNTWKDTRFSYRKNFVAASINPVNGAQMIRVGKDFYKDNANVLDPFCGVGTLLLERRLQSGRQHPVRALYGVDVFGQAIEGGRENAGILGCSVNFIRRDFFDFTHEYLFDEVITDMPDNFEDEWERMTFYKRFFSKIQSHLASDAHMFIYTLHGACMDKVLDGFKMFQCVRKADFSDKNDAAVFVLEYVG